MLYRNSDKVVQIVYGREVKNDSSKNIFCCNGGFRTAFWLNVGQFAALTKSLGRAEVK